MLLKERYEQDFRLVSSTQGWLALGLLAAALLALPLVAPGWTYLAMLFFVYGLVAVGLNLLVGFTGQFSLGHAGFFALGAYTAGYLLSQGVSFLLALPAAALLAALAGFLVGIPALRLSGPYLAVATLGFGLAVQQSVGNARWLGGHDGLIVDRPTVLGLSLAEDGAYYYVVLAVAAGLALVAFNVARSHLGRAFVAIRDAELAAQTSGVNLAAYKTLAFAISAGFAGAAGGLYAPLLGIVAPEEFNVFLSILFLSMVVVGGVGTVAGGILGAGFVVLLQQWLSQAGNLAQVIYGGVVILVMMVEPLGLYGRWLKVKAYWKGWPF